ncbi:MAG: hypothetical protein VW127_07510 [Flavobacteriaceae bacterium]
MIVKIFNTIGSRSFVFTFVLVFFTVFFSFFCINNGTWFWNQSLEILGNISLIILSIALITGLEIQIKGRKLDGIHMIVFPTIFLFFPFVYDLKVIPVFLGLIMILGYSIFINTLHSKTPRKWIFDLSLIISIMTQFKVVFAILYILPVMVILKKGLKDRRSLLALLLPVSLIPFTVQSVLMTFPSEMNYFNDHTSDMGLLQLRDLTNEEIVWIIMVALSLIICFFQIREASRKFSYPKLFSGFAYMTFWLLFSVLYGFLGLHFGEGRWFFSFIPVAYFFGAFLESLKTDLQKNTLFILLFFGAIIFKLLEYKIISL